MEQTLLTTLQGISWAGTAGLFVYYVLRPLVSYILKKQGKNDNIDSIADIVENKLTAKFEGNHFSEFYRRLDRLERKQDEIQKEIEEVKIETVKLKAKCSQK